jgi:hypothetical protein
VLAGLAADAARAFVLTRGAYRSQPHARESQTFESIEARDDHRNGWSSAIDCLAEYLATLNLNQRK